MTTTRQSRTTGVLIAAVLVAANGCDRKGTVQEPAGAPAPQSVAPPVDEGTSIPRADAKRELSSRERVEWTVAALTAAFESEARDDAWARDAEQELEAVATRVQLPPKSVVAARCRATICMVRMTLPGEAMDRALAAIKFDPAFATSGFVAKDAQQPSGVLVFVSRDGTMLDQHPHFLRAVAEMRSKST